MPTKKSIRDEYASNLLTEAVCRFMKQYKGVEPSKDGDSNERWLATWLSYKRSLIKKERV